MVIRSENQVIRLVAKVLQEIVGEVGLAARYGGGRTDRRASRFRSRGCAEVAERIRLRISESAPDPGAPTGQAIASVTVSIGVALFRRPNPPRRSLSAVTAPSIQAKRARTQPDGHGKRDRKRNRGGVSVARRCRIIASYRSSEVAGADSKYKPI